MVEIFFKFFFFFFTFGDVGAGRLSKDVVMTGNIFLNGKKKRLDYGEVVSNLRALVC